MWQAIKALSWGAKIGILFAFLGLLASCYFYGLTQGKSEANLKIARYETQVAELQLDLASKQDEVKEKVVTKYVDRIQYIRETGNDNKEAVDHIKPTTELRNNWVSIHDAAASGNKVQPSELADERPSGITDTQALGTVVNNYGTCNETREQLRSLQEYVKEHDKAIEESNKKDSK